MARVAVIKLSLLALLGLGAIPSSAIAAACVKTAGTKFALCLGEPLVLTEGSFTVHDEADGIGYIGRTPSITMECEQVKGVGTLTAERGSVTTSNVRLEYSVCEIPNPANCIIKEPITTEPLKDIAEELARGRMLLTPQTGEVFTTITFQGRECLIAGSRNAKLLPGGKGGVLCIASLETTKVLQLSSCSQGNSALDFGSEAATFEGSYNTKLLSKAGVEEKWAIIEGT